MRELGDGATLEEQLDDLDTRLRCVDLDNENGHLSRETGEASLVLGDDAPKSSVEQCLDKLELDEPMSSGGQGIHDGVGWLMAHPRVFIRAGSHAAEQERRVSHLGSHSLLGTGQRGSS